MRFLSRSYRRKHINIDNKKEEDFKETRNLGKIFNLDWFQYFYEIKLCETYTFESFVRLLHKPTCSSSLGVVRVFFGLMMVIDIPDERGLANIDVKFGDSTMCHFPLFHWLTPLPLEYMGLLYCIMWLGALGICFGYKFQTSCLMFVLPYSYIYILDKTVWNNHSYLYGLISLLLTFTSANNSFSLDALFDPSIRNKPVPLWNYAIIRFQFFLLYFYAGIKKFDPDWIGGYSMSTLGLHWVFDPFRLVLTNEQIDFWIIHIFGFSFDLTVGFFLLIDKTRPVAMLFSTAFHLMNSCMFEIGQFPYVCLVTTPIFCDYSWPNQFWKYSTKFFSKLKKFEDPSQQSSALKISTDIDNTEMKIMGKHKMTFCLLALYIGIQLFLPFSHFITQGYNNWTNGLYGYSWDMMVKNWDSNIIVVKVVDNQSKEEFFLDPGAWVRNLRYSKHGDMLIQYAECIKRNLKSPEIRSMKDVGIRSSFNDISIYVDVWYSMNRRFQQRMFDPRQDLLKAEWSPFKKFSWLMPLLSNLSSWRKNMADLEKEVFSWSNYSDVLFIADFPGLHLENYISPEFRNVTVTVLQGTVILERFDEAGGSGIVNTTLFKGDSHKINEGTFHKIYTIAQEPSCYMYTFNNHSMEKLGSQEKERLKLSLPVVRDMLLKNVSYRIKNFLNSLLLLQACLNKLLFDIPIPKTVTQMQ